jgi:hypothetical protein
LAAPPIVNATGVNANDPSEPLQMCAKIGMTQEATDEHRSFVGSNVQPNQTATSMAQSGIEIIEVAREECWLLEPKKQGNNLRIL